MSFEGGDTRNAKLVRNGRTSGSGNRGRSSSHGRICPGVLAAAADISLVDPVQVVSTPGSGGGDFWRRVSQTLSYIDVSARSSVSQSPQQQQQQYMQRSSFSWNVNEDQEDLDLDSISSRHSDLLLPSHGLTLGLALAPNGLFGRPSSSSLASFHSQQHGVFGGVGSLSSSRPLSDASSLHRPLSVLDSPVTAQDSVVETDGLRAAKTKIHKRLSFGDILDTQTNIYTPEEEDVPQVPSLLLEGSSMRRGYHHKKRKKKSASQSFISQCSARMDKDLRYYFQHPWARLFITYFVIFCNFLIFAEDPVSHSRTESNIPVVGNVFSFVLTKYPPEWYWSFVKVTMWLLAILCGMVLGKLLIHGLFFGKVLRVKMFRDEQGSWMTMFLTVIVALFLFSHAYNMLLAIWYDKHCIYKITSAMGVTNASVMKAAACGTWLGDLITALMVTDMMLQDNLYPSWASGFRKLWRQSNVPRILIFWVGSVVATAVVVTLIVSDWISWDRLNKDFVATTELSRAFLASFVLVMDLLIVMQDWDFPHFTTTMHVNLPGFSVATLQWNYAELQVSGKWFNYGIIFLVMILDLNMWKNQIFYDPISYGQYTGPDDKVWTVMTDSSEFMGNDTYWTWEARYQINPNTSALYLDDDMKMNSRYMGYPLSVKWTAFIPNVLGFVLFFALVSRYGRFPPSKDSRLRKRDGRRSSWRRERGPQGEACDCTIKPEANATAAPPTGNALAAMSNVPSSPASFKKVTNFPLQPKDDDAL